jgi:hypothetical protein
VRVVNVDALRCPAFEERLHLLPTVRDRMKQAPVPRMPHESYAEPPVSTLIECAIGEGVKGVRNKLRVVVDIEAPPLIADLIDRATAANERPAECSATNAAGLALAPWQLDRILIYIEENFADRLRNCELAQLITLSTSHFSRALFRQTPRAWRRANLHCAPEKSLSRTFPVGANLDGRWRSTVQIANPTSL